MTKSPAITSNSAIADTSILHELHGFWPQIMRMAWVDIQKEYKGAIFNWLWAIARPLIYLLVYWFVLKFGLKANTMAGKGIDLFPWLVAGLVAWFFCSDMINAGMTAIKKYSYLVTKMKFPVAAIPIFITLSNLFTHVVLLGVCLLYFIWRGDCLDITWIQLPIYTLLMAAFFMMWSFFSAPLAVISKDFVQLVKSILRILFWVSGVIWNVRGSTTWMATIASFNPITFFIEGYRDALLYHQWIWENPRQLITFLIIFAIMIFMGIRVYKRTRKEIADLL